MTLGQESGVLGSYPTPEMHLLRDHGKVTSPVRATAFSSVD